MYLKRNEYLTIEIKRTIIGSLLFWGEGFFMSDAVGDSKQKDRQASYWSRCTKVQNEIMYTIYFNQRLEEEQFSAVMDIIQNSSPSNMDEKTIADAIVQQCFEKEEVAVTIQCLNKGKNWLIKIQKNG